VILTLGNFAAQALLGTKDGITKLRGRAYDYRGIVLVPTFHPAFLLRNPGRSTSAWLGRPQAGPTGVRSAARQMICEVVFDLPRRRRSPTPFRPASRSTGVSG